MSGSEWGGVADDRRPIPKPRHRTLSEPQATSPHELGHPVLVKRHSSPDSSNPHPIPPVPRSRLRFSSDSSSESEVGESPVTNAVTQRPVLLANDSITEETHEDLYCEATPAEELEALVNLRHYTNASPHVTREIEAAEQQEEREKLQREVQVLGAEVGRLQKERDGLIQGVDGLQKERDGLIQGVDGLQKERDGLIQGVGRLQKEREGLIQGVDGLQKERDGLIQGVDRLQKERDGLIQGVGRLQTQQRELEEVVSRLVCAQQQQQQQQKSGGGLSPQKEAELLQMEQAIAQREKEVEEREKEVEEQLTSARDREFHLRQEESRLQRSQDEVASKKKALDIQEFELQSSIPSASTDSSAHVAELAERQLGLQHRDFELVKKGQELKEKEDLIERRWHQLLAAERAFDSKRIAHELPPVQPQHSGHHPQGPMVGYGQPARAHPGPGQAGVFGPPPAVVEQHPPPLRFPGLPPSTYHTVDNPRVSPTRPPFPSPGVVPGMAGTTQAFQPRLPRPAVPLPYGMGAPPLTLPGAATGRLSPRPAFGGAEVPGGVGRVPEVPGVPPARFPSPMATMPPLVQAPGSHTDGATTGPFNNLGTVTGGLGPGVLPPGSVDMGTRPGVHRAGSGDAGAFGTAPSRVLRAGSEDSAAIRAATRVLRTGSADGMAFRTMPGAQWAGPAKPYIDVDLELAAAIEQGDYEKHQMEEDERLARQIAEEDERNRPAAQPAVDIDPDFLVALELQRLETMGSTDPSDLTHHNKFPALKEYEAQLEKAKQDKEAKQM